MRLDIFITTKYDIKSREKAKELISKGLVKVNDAVAHKSSCEVKETDDITVDIKKDKFVSRAGYKLEKGLDRFDINLKDKLCLDIGASTGGFTDCMLQCGARKVYAVDCGHSQLDDKLRNLDKVINIEKYNARNIILEDVGDELFDFIAMDVSFISIRNIIDKFQFLLKEDGLSVVLLKPQFETGKKQKDNVVKDKKLHEKIIIDAIFYVENQNLKCIDITYSPITGKTGNIEFLLFLARKDNKNFENTSIHDSLYIKNLVSEAHKFHSESIDNSKKQ